MLEKLTYNHKMPPNGKQLIIVGGSAGGRVSLAAERDESYSASIYMLVCSSRKKCEWKLTRQSLDVKREGHVAVMVPNDFCECSI